MVELPIAACLEDLDKRTPRGIDPAQLRYLTELGWIREHLNLLITGSTGVGKSFIASAFAHAACRGVYNVAVSDGRFFDSNAHVAGLRLEILPRRDTRHRSDEGSGARLHVADLVHALSQDKGQGLLPQFLEQGENQCFGSDRL